MAEMNMVEAVRHVLDQEMGRDKDVILYGEDIGKNGGVFRTTDGLQKKYGEKRVIDSPLAEVGIIGTAIGMAAYGLKPVVEIQFSGFAYAGLENLISHAARIRNRTRGMFTCPMVMRTPYGGGIRALEHHSESVESLYIHIPGLKVVIPSTPYEAKGLLASAIRDPDPVIFLEPKRVYRSIKEEVPSKSYTIPLGKCRIVQHGSDITVITWGAMLKYTMEALAKMDISAEVIDVRTLSPFDEKTVIDSVKKTGRAVIVQEAVKTLGFASEIIARINEKALLSLEAPVKRITAPDIIFPLFKLENEYLPGEEDIIKGIKEVLEF
ncbi:alpha-ketoacid dehydrogenase subunit beta [Candidatus Woesearchaeota archaeon]|nr:alpha-ketoacid dehydrogenase subunit beta [Candidatus Woesearchaeota archaeon]